MLDFPLKDITEPSLEAVQLEDLLGYLKQFKQVDLTGYKRSTLMRRIRLRMKTAGAEHYQEYLDRLMLHPDEITQLLNTIFINFTSFFRDRFVWDFLEHEIISQIIAKKKPDEPIRIWSAGCASGAETYSLAILLAEFLGIEQFQRRVRICGTDIDSDAVLQARKGCYSTDEVAEVPPDLLAQYFEKTAIGYRCCKKLCHSILFYDHDLLQASPPPQIDLLVCRNTLMYFTSEAQTRIVTRLHYSLKQHGFLLLGQSESLVTRLQRSLFSPADTKVRLYRKVPGSLCYSE